MALQPLSFPPGVVRIGTDGMARGRWWNANLIRWRGGTLQPVGGWERLTSTPFAFPARKMLSWRTLLDTRYVVIGTDTQLLLLDGATYVDKTPDDFVPLPPITGEGGYGTGKYDMYEYDTPRPAGASGPGGNPYARGHIWTMDTFGEDVFAVASSDGRLLHLPPKSLDTPAGFPAQAEVIATAPVSNRAVVVTEERHVMLFGAEGNPRRVAWCSREDYNDWDFADPDNTAGWFDIDTHGVIINALKVRGGVLVWTEKELWIVRYVGMPAIYSWERIGQACGMIGPNAFAAVAGTALWAGLAGFWAYNNGTVSPLKCDIADYFFATHSPSTTPARIVGGANGVFNEAWWFFPSIGQTENNRYIFTNFEERWWSLGSLGRTAIDGAGVWPTPLMAGVDKHLYQHERGWTDAGKPRLGNVWVESAAQEVPSAGDRIMHVLGAQLDSGMNYDSTQMRAFTRQTRDDPVEYAEGPFVPATDGWVECRFSGRDIRLRVEGREDAPWSVGRMRFDAKPGGGR